MSYETSKMKIVKLSGVFVPLFASIYFLLGIQSVSAAEACVVAPASVNVIEGGQTSLTVSLAVESTISPFELKLGSLPVAVEGGFSGSSLKKSEGSKKITLYIYAKKGAQTGSFMVPVIYRVGTSDQSICQFNLVVSAATGKVKTVATKSKLTPTISQGTLPPERAKTLTSTLQLGSRGGEVLLLQTMLQEIGFFPTNTEPSGYFGAITETAVKLYQNANKLAITGIVDLGTRNKFLGR